MLTAQVYAGAHSAAHKMWWTIFRYPKVWYFGKASPQHVPSGRKRRRNFFQDKKEKFSHFFLSQDLNTCLNLNFHLIKLVFFAMFDKFYVFCLTLLSIFKARSLNMSAQCKGASCMHAAVWLDAKWLWLWLCCALVLLCCGWSHSVQLCCCCGRQLRLL